jgi:nucleoside-diphosphate-sugar epimerase
MKANCFPSNVADAMVIVVTGGNSFLARHLIPHLAKKNIAVFATYRTADERLEPLQSVPGVHLVRFNVGDGEGYGQLPREADAVVHVAAASTARAGGIDDFITCNVLGARNVARYARAAGVKKLIYTSSISVYGDVHGPYLQETHPITNPDDYGLTKYLAERVFAETGGVPCVALRLPGILGKGAHRAWIPTLVQRVLEGDRKATIYSPSSLFNNAAHVQEISEFVWQLLNSAMSGFNAVNVAAIDPITIREVITLMADTLGETIEIIERPAPKPSFTISSERAERLGYKALPVRQILSRYFEESCLSRVKAADKVR